MGEAEVDLLQHASNDVSQYGHPIAALLQVQKPIHYAVDSSWGETEAYQRKTALQVSVGPSPPFLIHQLEFPANLWLPNTLGLLRNLLPLHSLFLIPKIENQAGTRGQEEDAGANVERAGSVARFQLLN